MTEQTQDAILRVENLRTQLMLASGAIDVVRGVSFSVNAGETLGIVGESGSGKSMTALSVMRVLPRPIGRIAGGAIWLEGRNLVELSDAEMTKVRGRQIGMILQDPHTSLNPVFTVGDQLVEALQLTTGGARRGLVARAIGLMKQVNVADAERRFHAYPHQMSGGMKQRVVGAISLAGAPKVIIADEPTTALDVTIQLQYLQLLEDIQHDTGTAIVFITHDLGIVSRLCHRLVVMYAGRIVEKSTKTELLRKPLHAYTRSLLQSIPARHAKGEELYTIPGLPPDMTDPPVGCAFRPRNTMGDASACLTDRQPELCEIEPGHIVQNCPGCLG